MRYNASDIVTCHGNIINLILYPHRAFSYLCFDWRMVLQKELLDILDRVAIDDLLVVLSVANMCSNACEGLSARCIELVVKSDVDVVTLDSFAPLYC